MVIWTILERYSTQILVSKGPGDGHQFQMKIADIFWKI